MRIVLIVRGNPLESPAGTELYVGNLANWLVSDGHKVEIVYGANETGSISRDGIVLNRVRVPGLPIVDSAVFALRVARLIGRDTKLEHPEVLIAFGAATFPFIFFNVAERSYDVPLLVYRAGDTAWSEFMRTYLGGKSMRLRDRLTLILVYIPLIVSEVLSLKRADLSVGTSIDTVHRLVSDYGPQTNEAIVNYPGIPSDFAKGSVSVFPPVPTFLHIAGSSHKGTECFMLALKKLKTDYSILSRGIVTRATRNDVDRWTSLGLEGTLHNQATLDELKSFYATCTAVVCPSLSEGFCLPVIEAGAFGKPAVVSDAGSLPELVLDGITGFVVPVNDCDKLAKRMSTIAKEPTLAKRMGDAARDRANQFTVDASGRLLLNAIIESHGKSQSTHP
jgi:glycosyltransferase involved in cell wall biosynthesis